MQTHLTKNIPTIPNSIAMNTYSFRLYYL